MKAPLKWWHDIHRDMSSSELKFYFGVHSANGVDSHSYEVAHIVERHSVEKRSGIEQGCQMAIVTFLDCMCLALRA